MNGEHMELFTLTEPLIMTTSIVSKHIKENHI